MTVVALVFHPDFEMPSQGSPIGRLSSITGSLVHMLVPWVPPTAEEVDRALAVLGMARGAQCVCAYCGGPRTEWDHLRPLVCKRRPTGFITELANLVPACGKCNQSKSGAAWRDWLPGKAKRSPRSRGASDDDIQRRCHSLEAFESAFPPRRIDFERMLGTDRYGAYWEHLAAIEVTLKNCTDEGKRLRAAVGSQGCGQCDEDPTRARRTGCVRSSARCATL